MKILVSETAKKQLKKFDKSIQKKIIGYLEEVAGLEDPRTRGKGLSSNLAGLWRYRVGDYRLICEIKDEILTVEVVRIGHRREVYD
jgi:mRNA interferase RelE/StbE